jgi:SAM-dependent methyltransferase
MNACRIPETIATFYDANVGGKLEGFIEGNPRVERAWLTVERWAPFNPRRILEVGCGIGDICWRMSRRWPEAMVVGMDISQKSLEIARKLFESPKLSFLEGPLENDRVAGKFDLILLMDVYEHIAVESRPRLHSALRKIQAPGCRMVLSFPTPRHLAWLRGHQPDQIQPIDEDVWIETMSTLAKDLGSEILLYQEVGVWHEGDYAHAVLGRVDGWIAAATQPDQPTIKQRVRYLLRAKPTMVIPSRSQRRALVQERLHRFDLSTL